VSEQRTEPADLGGADHAGGSGKLQDIAEQLGIDHADAAGGLAELLPQVVNHLTPNGVVQDDLVQQGLSLLKGKLLG
jgi:uncharacterized protein YidB (DUF937 family)